jgi:hypothetical protein
MRHNPDIIDRLVDLAVRLNPDSEAGSAMCDAADEIKRLRVLINAWADAEDEADMIRAVDLFIAYQALRQAVGR